MTNNQASEQVWALRPAAMVVAVLTMVLVALLAATPAWASDDSVSDVSVSILRVNPAAPDPTIAGNPAQYQIAFTPTHSLQGGKKATS